MTIEQQLTTQLKEAMRAKNKREVDVLRMIKARAMEAKVAPGFEGETDDAFWLDVVIRYVKQQKKALFEFEKAGDQGAEQAEQVRFEIDYLAPFMPSVLGEAEVREAVRQAIATLGVTDAKMAGRVTGAVVKEYRDRVDPQVVKRIATEELSS